MLKNYFISAFRSLLKDRLYAVINTAGLAVGLATCYVIYAWVSYELSYDTYLPKTIYRVTTHWDEAPEEGYATAYPMIKSRVLGNLPDVATSTRLFDVGFLGGKTPIAFEEKTFTDLKFYYGDTSFFDVFPFHLVAGDKQQVFQKKNAVLITERTAKKIFGDEYPIGKVLKIGTNREMEITGVIENIPDNTHFNFDVLASMESHPWIRHAEESLWSGIVFHTYVRLQPDVNPVDVQNKIAAFLDAFPNDPDHVGASLNMILQPIQDIHLQSHLNMELQPNANITYVYVFTTIAILVLFIACINYVNLATARYTQRFKEVGLRKVMGAFRRQLITQFMVESMVVTCLSLIVAMVLIELFRPLVFAVSGQNYFLDGLYTGYRLLALLGIALMVGVVSGIFPAFILSSFRPVQLFRPSFTPASGIGLRKGLVIFQFVISIALTLCTVITYRQLEFIRNTNLGYDKDNIMVLHIGYPEVRTKYQELKTQLLQSPLVSSASAVSQLPTNVITGENIDVPGGESYGVNFMSVDPDFFKTMNVTIVEGQDQLHQFDTVRSNRFVVNESVLQKLGWSDSDAINKMISIRHGNQVPGPVIGVVSDFHFQSLHNPMSPLVFEFSPDMYEYLLLRIQPGHPGESIAYARSVWTSMTDIPFEYEFLDDAYNQLYKQENQSGSLFLLFATIASCIALLGLFGLSSFAVTKRTKEMGIRKVLGARSAQIINLLTREFVLLVLIAFVVAIPVGYYFKETWLSTFAYKTNIGPSVFIIAGMLNLTLALLTLLHHALKAANTNPVETLKYE